MIESSKENLVLHSRSVSGRYLCARASVHVFLWFSVTDVKVFEIYNSRSASWRFYNENGSLKEMLVHRWFTSDTWLNFASSDAR